MDLLAVFGGFLLILGPLNSLAPAFFRAHGIVLLISLYFGLRYRSARYFALAFVSVLVSAAIELSGLDAPLRQGVYLVAMGMAFLVAGGITLLSYLRNGRP